MMHGHEKSRSAIVAVKPTNKAERSAAEPVERRAEAEGNVSRQSTHRAQYRARVAQALACIRRVVAVDTRGGNRMRESCMYGSVRGAASNGGPYRDRREFIALLGGTAAWPLVARAQQGAKPLIGYLSGRSPDTEAQYRAAFRRGLAEAGFVEGHNVEIEFRFSNGQEDRLPALATDLVRRQAAVLVATDTGSAVAARAASTTIPIVFSTGADPVKLGLVDSLNRPNGNATGVAVFVTELGPKRLQLLRELVPNAEMIAYIVNLNTVSGPAQAEEMQVAAQAIGQRILVLSASSNSEVGRAFAAVVERKAAAIVYSASVFFQVARELLVSLAAQHSIPAIYEWPEFVAAGGLMSYSSSRSEAGRQIGSYAGQILRGAKPADLPVVQSSKFELVINLKTAKSLGLTIPPGILAIADDVIE
jgi:putative tryptophan/tyrosine transport system substrate-binding protein